MSLDILFGYQNQLDLRNLTIYNHSEIIKIIRNCIRATEKDIQGLHEYQNEISALKDGDIVIYSILTKTSTEPQLTNYMATFKSNLPRLEDIKIIDLLEF